MGKAVLTMWDQAPIEKLKAEGKRTGPFENLNQPPDGFGHRKSKKIITINIIAASTNTPDPAHSFYDEIINNASQNTLVTKTPYPSSKISYSV